MATTYAHSLTLTATDFDSLSASGARWAKTLLGFGVKAGNNGLSADEAWNFYRVVDMDTKSSTKALPGLSKCVDNKLAERVWGFLYSLV